MQLGINFFSISKPDLMPGFTIAFDDIIDIRHSKEYPKPLPLA